MRKSHCLVFALTTNLESCWRNHHRRKAKRNAGLLAGRVSRNQAFKYPGEGSKCRINCFCPGQKGYTGQEAGVTDH